MSKRKYPLHYVHPEFRKAVQSLPHSGELFNTILSRAWSGDTYLAITYPGSLVYLFSTSLRDRTRLHRLAQLIGYQGPVYGDVAYE
jgi:hypothetical protein